MRVILVIGIVLLAVVLTVQNYTVVTLNFFAWTMQASLAVVIVVCLAAGAVLASLAFAPGLIRSRSGLRKLERRIVELEADNSNLTSRVSGNNQPPR